MKKIFILFILLACSAFVFSQAFVKNSDQKRSMKADKDYVSYGKAISERNNDSKNVIWSENFEGAIADWDFGHLDAANSINWTVGDAAQAVQSNGFTWVIDQPDRDLAWLQQVLFPWQKSAYIDVIGTSSDPTFGGSGQDLAKAYIQIDNIPLSDVSILKLIFSQRFRKLNNVAAYVEWKSSDATNWTSVQVNADAADNDWISDDVEILLTGTAGVDNLSIRWIWNNVTMPNQGFSLGYWWIIDNIQIVEADEYDITLEDFRVSSFYVRDYHGSDAIVTTTGGVSYNKYFHYSSYYGTYAKDVDQGVNNILMFHGVVKNMGSSNVTPGIKIDIYAEDDEDNIIWTKTKYKTTTLAPGAIDTVDIWYIDENGENYFDLNLCEIGSYIVKFEAVIEEGEDITPDNGINYSYFKVTQDIFSRDYNDAPSSRIGPSNWSGGGVDGDKMGVNFMFFNTTDLYGIDYYLSDNTEAGTAIVFSVLQWNYNTGQWVSLTSQRVDIESAEMAGKWHSLDFDIPIQITKEDVYISDVILSATFYYGGGKTLFVGNDNTHNANYHSTLWFFSNSVNWGGLTNSTNTSPSLRFRTSSLSEPTVVCPDNINIAMDTITTHNSTICFSGATPVGGTYSGTSVYNNCMNLSELFNFEYTITYTYESESCTFKVRLNETYVPSLEDLGINIYPNPTNGDLRIDNIKGATVEILNTMGQVINKIENANEFNTVDISEFANGTYFVKIILDGKVGVERINLMK
ncbi:MAG: T9SS type A sorting domain-containing protein [Bacteroidales bacterium]|nr:T9SS type A sorting domain-containing protein [Bacteroidales bacterium]